MDRELHLSDIRVVTDGRIFDLQKQRFVDLETSSRNTCRSVILTFAKKLLKVTYFRWHRCSHSDIKG